MSLSTTLVRSLAGLYPLPVEVDDGGGLAESLAFVDSPHDAETVLRAGYGAGVVAALVPLALLATAAPLSFVLFFVLVTPVAAIHAVHSFPRLQAALRRTEALGDAPTLVGRVVLRMQVQPALESAVRFAVETGDGPLVGSLAGHVDRARGTANTGLLSFAEEWAAWVPALRRSTHLLATAQDAPAGERGRTLDRSLSAILDGTRNRMAEFTAAIRAPTTAVFSFGVMIPLSLIALIPAVPMVGVPVNIWIVVLLYNVVLPIVLVGASLWLLVRRPVAFPPPTVDHTHPDVPDRLWLRGSWGVAAGGCGYALMAVAGPSYLAPIVGVGLGIGVALLAIFHPILEVRNHVREVEAHLTDALYVVGRQVAEGESVESAIDLAADRVPGETGAVFDHAAGVQRRLRIDVEAAFLGEYGALADVPSPRAHSTAALLAIAADEGRPAGRAIVSMADHLEELEAVENEAKRSLEQATSTLENTAAYFGPLVAGATVAMAAMMSTEEMTGAMTANPAAFPAEQLAIVVGVFLLVLCFVLVPLSIALRHGIDRALVGYHVGRALVSAMVLYGVTVTLVATAL